jgi:hypothetical protein
MALENTAIQDKLVAIGEAVYNFQQERDIFFEINADQNKLLSFLEK